MSKINYPAIFNDTDLNTVSGLTVLRTDPYRPPKRDVSLSDLIRTNKSKVSSAFYTERRVTVRIEITRDTRDQLEQSLDELMAIIQPIEKTLVLNQSGRRRKYYCTFEDAVVMTDNEGGSYIEMDLVFVCSDRFGYDLTATTLLSITSAYTSAARSDALNFQGSALWQTPVITITYSAIGSGVNKSVAIGNGATGQVITITRTWTAGDKIEVDALNETVKVNGVDVDYTGAIPKWKKGIGYWSYSDNFTSRSFTGLIACAFRYA
jgi:hypothetical protein